MEQKPSVILGKPMRRYKAKLISDENDKTIKDDTVIDIKELGPPSSPSKPVKTLLEERFDSKQSESVQNQPENIGVDKRLLLSVLSSKNVQTPIMCGWTPFLYVKTISNSTMNNIRKTYNILIEGSNIPPLALKFKDMRLPFALCEYLEKVKKISDPSLIQMQGIPVALATRDLIGIASTGSGKTLSFCIPMILFALEAEMKLPFLPGEGPIGIILAPSVRTIFIFVLTFF